MKLNLGCGKLKLEGFINLDGDASVEPDMVWNLEEGLPFEDNSCDYIVASHVLEHIRDFVALMEECGRVLISGGKMMIRVPEFPSIASVANPYHLRFFVPQSFMYFTRSGCFGDVLPLEHYWVVEDFLPGKSSPGLKELVVLLSLDEEPIEAKEVG